MLDMPLEEIFPFYFLRGRICFNPSYAGYASGRSVKLNRSLSGIDSFNPSYAGYASGSSIPNHFTFYFFHVSILLMLDMPLEGQLPYLSFVA